MPPIYGTASPSPDAFFAAQRARARLQQNFPIAPAPPAGQAPPGAGPDLAGIQNFLGQFAQQDPYYRALLAAQGQDIAGERAFGQQGIARAFTQLGYLPDNLNLQGALYQGLDLGALGQQAGANEFSIWNEIARQYTQQLGRAYDVAGARGLARSGETVVAERELGREKKKKQSSSIEELLDYLAQLERGFSQFQGAQRGAAGQAYQQALTSGAQFVPPSLTAPMAAAPAAPAYSAPAPTYFTPPPTPTRTFVPQPTGTLGTGTRFGGGRIF